MCLTSKKMLLEMFTVTSIFTAYTQHWSETVSLKLWRVMLHYLMMFLWSWALQIFFVCFSEQIMLNVQ